MNDVGTAVTVNYQAPASAQVTARLIPPVAAAQLPVTVAAGSDPDTYPFTFTPDALGVWRVQFRDDTGASATMSVTVTDAAGGPAPFASAATIATMWRDLTGDEISRCDVLCRYASALIRAKVPGVDARIGAGTLSAGIPELVCAQMVLRVLRNPSGVAAETVGPWSVTYGSTGTQATGLLTLTDEDLALLTGTPTGARRGHAALVMSPSRFSPRYRPWRAWDAEA